ncbi:hypothetical protein, partial [Enterobacter hormaechei]|uniref:hypothetical protein n=1 Tax=Enterobacter hormaechei TaxID=158836 RepID=UPI001F4A7562
PCNNSILSSISIIISIPAIICLSNTDTEYRPTTHPRRVDRPASTVAWRAEHQQRTQADE